jgi:hypothetical protein
MSYDEQQRAIIEGLARGIAWRVRADEAHLGPVHSTTALAERWRLSERQRLEAILGAAKIAQRGVFTSVQGSAA